MRVDHVCVRVDLEFGLDFAQLPPRQDLDVRADLLARPRLARAQFDVARDQLVATCPSNRKKVQKKTNNFISFICICIPRSLGPGQPRANWVFFFWFFFMGSIAEIRFICIMIEPNDSSERNSVNRMKKNGPKFAFW